MILLYPVVLAAAVVLVVHRHGDPRRRGWRWFAAWCAASALFVFSLLTGFSIGLLLLPAAAAALLLVAARAPGLAETLGFPVGIGVVAAVVGLLNWNESGGVDPVPWAAAGVAIAAAATVAYAVVKRADLPPPGASNRDTGVRPP